MHIFMAIGSEMFYFHRIASLFKTGSLGDVSGHTLRAYQGKLGPVDTYLEDRGKTGLYQIFTISLLL